MQSPAQAGGGEPKASEKHAHALVLALLLCSMCSMQAASKHHRDGLGVSYLSKGALADCAVIKNRNIHRQKAEGGLVPSAPHFDFDF